MEEIFRSSNKGNWPLSYNEVAVILFITILGKPQRLSYKYGKDILKDELRISGVLWTD